MDAASIHAQRTCLFSQGRSVTFTHESVLRATCVWDTATRAAGRSSVLATEAQHGAMGSMVGAWWVERLPLERRNWAATHSIV